MRITAVNIRNFRGIKSLDLELGPVTVLIGENNSGKTSVLAALKLCLRDLGPRRRVVFEPLDHHLSDSRAEPSSADPIEIEVTFADGPNEPWDDDLVRRLGRLGMLQVDGAGGHSIRLRVECVYDHAGKGLRPELVLPGPRRREGWLVFRRTHSCGCRMRFAISI